MSQHSGNRLWIADEDPEYKCLNIYFGIHNGHTGRGVVVYKVFKKRKLERRANVKYFWRRALNGLFRV